MKALKSRKKASKTLPSFSKQKNTAKKKTASIEHHINDLNNTLQFIEELVILLSSQETILFINQAALFLYGWKQKDVLGKSFVNLLKNNKYPSPLSQKLRPSSKSENIETVIDGKNKKIISWKLSSYEFGSKNKGRLLIGKDVTEVKKSEEKIFELDTIIAQIPGNLYWYSKDLVYLGCNENSAASLNMTREETVGKDFKALMKKVKTTDDSLVEAFVEQGKEVIRTGKPMLNIEEPPFYGPGHKLTYYLANKVPLRNKEGEVYGVIGISTDITYRKELEQNLRAEREKALAASKSKSEFIANMSHDIRTPIAGMLGVVQDMLNVADQTKSSLAETAEKKVFSKDLLNSLIESIHRDGELLMIATDELLQLCNEILEVVRLESGKVEEQPEAFCFQEVVQHNLDLLQPVARHKNLKLIYKIDTKIPHCLIGLRNYIDRTLLNLISNALKFTDSGWVKVTAKLLDKSNKPLKKADKIHISVSVEDTGMGIPSDKFETIFEHFSRLTPAYEGLYKGIGLGLYTVKQYIKAMDGTIEVKSKVGKGTCLRFAIPLIISNVTKRSKIADACPVQPPKINTISPSTKATLMTKINKPSSEPVIASILLVEDSPMAAMAATIALKKLNCAVDIAENGAQAVEKAQKGQYDLIIMDVGLPDFSGVEATKRIRTLSDKTKAQTPIVALTGHADNGEKRQECIEAGMQEILTKPLQPLAFETILQEVVMKPSSKPHSSSKTNPNINISTSTMDIIDWETCVRMCQGDSQLAHELLSMLDEDLKKTKKTLADAFKQRNISILRDELHRLRGGVAYLKLPQLEEALKIFHEAVKAEPQNQQWVEETYSALQKAIDTFLGGWKKKLL